MFSATIVSYPGLTALTMTSSLLGRIIHLDLVSPGVFRLYFRLPIYSIAILSCA